MKDMEALEQVCILLAAPFLTIFQARDSCNHPFINLCSVPRDHRSLSPRPMIQALLKAKAQLDADKVELQELREKLSQPVWRPGDCCEMSVKVRLGIGCQKLRMIKEGSGNWA